MRSRAIHFKEFLEGVVWQDMQDELVAWIDGAQEQLNVCSDDKEIYRFQGRLQAMKEVLGMPSGLLNILEEEQGEPEESSSEVDSII